LWYAKPYIPNGTPKPAVPALIAIQEAENAIAYAIRDHRISGLDQAESLLSQAISAYNSGNYESSEQTLDERTRATVGNIWHNVMSPGQRRARVSEAERKKGFYDIFLKAGLDKRSAYNLAVATAKDFGGWTSHNLDWERGYREGERKAEDRMRGIQVQRSREPQYEKKQAQQLERYTNPDNPVRIEQRRERRAGLAYRAGERKEQHQEPGTVVASVARGKDHLGPLADPEFHGEPFYEDAGEEPTYLDIYDVIEGKAREGTGAELTSCIS